MKIYFNVRHIPRGTDEVKNTYHHEFESDFVPRLNDTIVLPNASLVSVEQVQIFWDHTFATVWVRYQEDTRGWNLLMKTFPNVINVWSIAPQKVFLP